MLFSQMMFSARQLRILKLYNNRLSKVPKSLYLMCNDIQRDKEVKNYLCAPPDLF